MGPVPVGGILDVYLVDVAPRMAKDKGELLDLEHQSCRIISPCKVPVEFDTVMAFVKSDRPHSPAPAWKQYLYSTPMLPNH